jgi:hypothetical protein
VPGVHFYEGGERCPEDICFPSVLRSLLEYRGSQAFGCKQCMARAPECKVSCSYAFFVGVTGMASFLSWKPGWHADNAAIHNMAPDPHEPFRRGFSAAGFTFEWVGKEAGRDNEALFRARILSSVRDRGMPVLGFGVIGPPEPSIITGYDAGGDVLLGWSFFQNVPEFAGGVEEEPGGYFRKRRWFPDTETLAIVHGPGEHPPFAETVRSALQWMLVVAGTPLVRGRHNGLAAYGAWAEHLARDQDLPAGQETTLRERHEVHNNVVGSVAEARWYGAQFLIQAAEQLHYRAAEPLFRAAACYAAEHALMWQLWDLAGGNGNPDAFLKFAEPAIRREMIPIVLESGAKSAEAAGHIGRALA